MANASDEQLKKELQNIAEDKNASALRLVLWLHRWVVDEGKPILRLVRFIFEAYRPQVHALKGEMNDPAQDPRN